MPNSTRRNLHRRLSEMLNERSRRSDDEMDRMFILKAMAVIYQHALAHAVSDMPEEEQDQFKKNTIQYDLLWAHVAKSFMEGFDGKLNSIEETLRIAVEDWADKHTNTEEGRISMEIMLSSYLKKSGDESMTPEWEEVVSEILAVIYTIVQINIATFTEMVERWQEVEDSVIRAVEATSQDEDDNISRFWLKK